MSDLPPKEQNYLDWVVRFLKLSGWIFLFYVNWQFGLAFFCIALADQIERDRYYSLNETVLEHILSSLRSLIKKDDITEGSEKIKNN